MKTQNNGRFEKVLNIQGKAMRVNLPVGIQSSDYPEPETEKEVGFPRFQKYAGSG